MDSTNSIWQTSSFLTFFCKSTVKACHVEGRGPPHPFRLPIRPHGRNAGPAKCASRAAWLTLNWAKIEFKTYVIMFLEMTLGVANNQVKLPLHCTTSFYEVATLKCHLNLCTILSSIWQVSLENQQKLP